MHTTCCHQPLLICMQQDDLQATSFGSLSCGELRWQSAQCRARKGRVRCCLFFFRVICVCVCVCFDKSLSCRRLANCVAVHLFHKVTSKAVQVTNTRLDAVCNTRRRLFCNGAEEKGQEKAVRERAVAWFAVCVSVQSDFQKQQFPSLPLNLRGRQKWTLSLSLIREVYCCCSVAQPFIPAAEKKTGRKRLDPWITDHIHSQHRHTDAVLH